MNTSLLDQMVIAITIKKVEFFLPKTKHISVERLTSPLQWFRNVFPSGKTLIDDVTIKSLFQREDLTISPHHDIRLCIL